MARYRSVEAIREALGGERCGCGKAAAVIWHVRQDGSDFIRKTCAPCGEPLRREAAGGSGGGAILP